MSSKDQLSVVIGLGMSGLSCVAHLVAKGQHVAVIDSRPKPPKLDELRVCYPNVVCKAGGFDEKLLDAAHQLIISPGVSLKEPAIAKQIAKGKPVIGDIELFAREAKAPIVAITGSNGKSTVTSLVGEMAKESGVRVKVGGNIGIPALQLLTQFPAELYVLELSSFQLETTTSLKARCAVNLNISPDHMDRYDTLADYIRAKLRIYENCQTAIINLDDPASYQGVELSEDWVGFSTLGVESANFGLIKKDDVTYLTCGDELLISSNKLKLRGHHQLGNALAALAIGSVCGFDRQSMLTTLQNFPGLPHRCQLVGMYKNVAWFNDSKATNVGATAASLYGVGNDIPGKIIWLAGGQGKGASFLPLRELVSDYVRVAILFGEDSPKIEAAIHGATSIVKVKDMNEAVWKAKNLAQSGDAVLLAPACASFDMFNNFEHRGDVFVNTVKDLLK